MPSTLATSAIRTDLTIEYIVIVAYLLLMIIIGIAFRRFNRNTDDYFRGGSQATWWLIGMSTFMSVFSAVTFTGYSGQAFYAGWTVTAVYFGNATGMLIQALVLAPWFRQMRATTFPEIVRARFDERTQQVYAYLKMTTFVFGGSLWLFGLALFSASVFGLPVEVVIITLGVVALIYPLIGGKWAVIASDFIQGLILLGITVLLFVYCIYHIGGINAFFEKIDTRGLTEQFAFIKPSGWDEQNTYGLGWVIAVYAIAVITNCSMGSAVKFFAVKDGPSARKAALFGAVLMLLGIIFWFVPPMIARILFEGDILALPLAKPHEASVAFISTQFLPTGLIGMMVVAMFAATMSSMDVGINGNAAIFVKDILPACFRLVGKTLPTEKSLMLCGRISTFFFGGIIILGALYLSRQDRMGIFELMLNLGAIVGVPMSIPTLLCLFVRKVPPWSALLSLVAASIPSILALISSEQWTFQERSLYSILWGSLAFFASGIFWKTTSAEYRSRVDDFFKKMHTPVDYEKEVGVTSDDMQLTLVGRFTLAVGLFIALLVFLPNPLSGRLSIITLAVVFSLFGLFMIRKAKKTNKS